MHGMGFKMFANVPDPNNNVSGLTVNTVETVTCNTAVNSF
jgi:hypothetical protein